MAHWTGEDYRPIDPEQQSWDNGVDLYRMEVPEMEHGFHGTSHDVEDGVVQAAADRPAGTGSRNWDESPSHFVNYWTPNPLARLYRDGLADPENNPGATPAELRAEAEKGAWNWAGFGEGRPRVYEGRAVTAMDRPVGIDPNLLEDADMGMQHVLPMAAGAFEITDTHWIPPSDTGRAVQGTLPHVNWNQFGAPNVGNPEDVSRVSLSMFDQKVSTERTKTKTDLAAKKNSLTARLAEQEKVREQHRRDVAAGQMRLPGY